MHASAPVWLSALGALAAFLVALISFVLHNVPLGEVIDPAMFAAKVGILVAITNGVGAYLYWKGARKRVCALR